jgi:hypothetical protein
VTFVKALKQWGLGLIVLFRVLVFAGVPGNSLLMFFAVLMFVAVPGNLLFVFFAVLVFVASATMVLP